MNIDWNTFLQHAGAVLETAATGHHVRDFGHPTDELHALDNSSILADVSHMGLIAVHGADAATFLQGQLTNDIREVSATETDTLPRQCSQISAYCSPKGRMLACMRIFMRDDTYYLSLPRDILDATLQRLRLFVLRAKVTLSDASDTLVYVGHAGKDAASVLCSALNTVPSNINAHPNAVSHINGLTVLCLPGSTPRFGIIGDVTAMQVLWNTLRVSAQPVGAGVWDLLDIRAGIPTVYTATRDIFIPQMANLDAIGGISFKKGCYTGQEIVARMHYLGTLKRRMMLAKITAASSAPQPGDALYASSTDDAPGADVGRFQPPASGDTCASMHGEGDTTAWMQEVGQRREQLPKMPGTTRLQSIGNIVAAQPTARHGEYEVLAVADIKSAANHPIHWLSNTGPVLTFSPLPYTFEQPAKT